VIDRFNDERLRRKEQALCAAYLSLKNRELQLKMLPTCFITSKNCLGNIQRPVASLF